MRVVVKQSQSQTQNQSGGQPADELDCLETITTNNNKRTEKDFVIVGAQFGWQMSNLR